MSKRDPRDHHTVITDRVRWAKAMLDVMIADQDLQSIHIEAIAGISGHLEDAKRELEELYQELPHADGPRRTAKPEVVPIRKAASDETEPGHAQ